jgi:hypothetical protein
VLAGQVRLIGFSGTAAAGAAEQSPDRFDTTFGGLPAPSEVTSVARVQVLAPLLVDTTVTLVLPAGMLP